VSSRRIAGDEVATPYIENRILGRIDGESEGAILICVAGIHGNERAGITALRNVFNSLKGEEPNFRGEFIGIAGNLQALNRYKRFISKDLNRQFSSERADWLLNISDSELEGEDKEQKELLKLFIALKKKYPDRKIVMMDLHTTSASGGTFSIATQDSLSVRLCEELQVTTILGLESVLKGTTLNYFDEIGFTAMAFEAGQHEDPESISRMEAAIFLVLHALKSFNSKVVDDYKSTLAKLRMKAPRKVNFKYRHQINSGDRFVMKPGYKNFQKIEKGEHLADDTSGPICSEIDGMILMPLYQPQGDDGFFVVKESF